LQLNKVKGKNRPWGLAGSLKKHRREFRRKKIPKIRGKTKAGGRTRPLN